MVSRTAPAWLLPWLMLGLWLGMATPAFAQQAELVVITRDLEQGEIGAVRVRVRGERPTAPPRVPVSPPTGLNLTFQGQRQQVNILNGHVSKSFEYTYGIEALQPGSYTLGPAEIEVGTRKLRTSSGVVRVQARIGAQTDDLQARAGFDVDEAWVGQVVLYRRTIRSKNRILRDNWTDPPLDGLVPPRDGEPVYAEYGLQGADGVTFVKEEYHPKIVMEPGLREVPAAVARVTVATQSGSSSPLVRGPARTRVLPVKPGELVVNELPDPPPDFSGLVGDFDIDARVDRTEAAVGDSINQTVLIRGDGTLERFSLPRPARMDAIRIYDGTPATTARVDGDGYKAEGRYSRVLVPTRPGTLDLPPLKIVTFSPTREAYVTHEIVVPTLTVRKGRAGGSVFESFVDDTDSDSLPVVTEVTYEGVREIRVRGASTSTWIGAWIPWTLGLSGLPLVVLGLVELAELGRRVGRGVLDRVKTRQERELSPRQRLARLPAEPSARLAELDAVLRQALARRAGVAVAELDRDAVLDTLPGDLAARVREVTRRMDRARFGGAAAGRDLQPEVAELVRLLGVR